MVVTDTDWEDFDDLDSFGISICTSSIRPTAHEGRHIYETDTNKTMVYTGAAWEEISGGGGVTDHGALTGLADDDHTQYLLIDGTREMTGTLDMGANNVYLDSGILRMSDGTTLSGSIGFTTGVQNYIQRQLVSGSDYTLLSDQDYMHTWAILGTEKMHLSTADGLKMYTKINMNGMDINLLPAGTTNGDALRYEQIADASFTNLLKNGDFESWSAGASSAPDGWYKGAGGSVVQESTVVAMGAHSLELVSEAGNQAYIANSNNTDAIFYTQYKGKTVTMGCWVWCNTASKALLRIYDGLSDTDSAYHSGGSGWEFLTATKVMAAGANRLRATLVVYAGTITAYFDGVILVEGDICPAFSPKPLEDDGKSIQIDSTTNSVTIGRDPTADTEAATKKYVDDNAGVGDFLANGTVPMTGNLQMGDNDITGADTLQATASQNLTLKVSTGSSIVFQAV